MGGSGSAGAPEARGEGSRRARGAGKRRALGIAARGGLVYLAVACVVLKLASPDPASATDHEPLARAAVFGLLAGLPVIVMVAGRLGPLSVGAVSLWGPALLAAVSGLGMSFLCLTMASTPRAGSSELPGYLPASLRSGGQLRLRIDGLTISGARSSDSTASGREAELVISTRLIERGPDSGLLEVRARLLDGRGTVLWERCDAVDPDDTERLHRAVLRALAEGMELTGQGGGTIAGRPRPAHPPPA